MPPAQPSPTHPDRAHRPHPKPFTIACALLALLTPTPTLFAQGASQLIAFSGTVPPDGNGRFLSFTEPPLLNNAGQATFYANLTDTTGGTNDDRAIYRADTNGLTLIEREFNILFGNNLSNLSAPQGINNAGQVLYSALLGAPAAASIEQIRLASGGSPTIIASEDDPAPDANGTFLAFIEPTLNPSGQAAFKSILTGTTGGADDNGGIFIGSGGPITQVVRESQPAPDANGVFVDLGDPSLNDAGQAAFFGVLNGTTGGVSDNLGIFIGSGGPITQVVREGQTAPDANGQFADFSDPALNDAGQTAFFSSLLNTTGGASDNGGIYIGSGGPITQVARESQPAPDANGVLVGFSNPALNDAGQAAFLGILNGTTGGTSDNVGIFIGSGGPLTQVAREGQTAPDANGTISLFADMALNATGQIAFEATLTGTSDGINDNSAIFLADGIDTVQVARKGQVFADDTISDMDINHSLETNGNERSGLNDAGQVAYIVTLNNAKTAIALWTPPHVHWTAPSGQWSTPANWQSNITPKSLFDVTLDPPTGATIAGDTNNEFVKSLTVGTPTPGPTTRLNQDAADLTSLNPATINQAGHVHLGNDRVFNAPTLTNHGLLTGTGQINADFNNTPTGQVRTITGEHLTFTGPANTNNGKLEAIGGTIEFNHPITNAAPTGLIAARDATLRFNAGLTNNDGIGFTFGTSDIFGDITNSPTGIIVVSGASNLTIWDDLTNNGSVQVSAGSSAVYFGSVSGTGSFPGTGTHYFEADLAPGASPGTTNFGGDVVFGPFANANIEAQATTTAPVPGLGNDHDQINITGNVTFGGTLNVLPLPTAGPIEDTPYGNEYLAITYGTRTPNSFFNDITGTLINTSFALAPLLDDTTNELTLRATIPGDLNLDNKVSVADLSLFALNFNTTQGFYNETLQLNSWQLGDFNTDGQITVADLSLLALNFGFDASDPTSTPTPTLPYHRRHPRRPRPNNTCRRPRTHHAPPIHHHPTSNNTTQTPQIHPIKG